ncbi:hypothetical protein [Enterobacter sp. CC120223-11]|uniref:hypothetical protein n=1 Tax=Enterobacter sp. CC120223-11 TaxID=1378073 RepID=UPI000BD4E9CD|nr:hypothetical protein [Enterobacter sp. CC120223-11]SNY61502.1 hypothetical protein SAMN02744775_00588 [Enterobacter sp. CC120223-11]
MNKFFAAIIIAVVYSASAVSAEKVIDCKITHTLHHDVDTVSITYKLHMADNIGTMIMYGIFDEAGKKSIISRQVMFDYKSVDDTGYQLVSKEIISFSAETVSLDAMQRHYPGFFLKEGMHLFMSISDFSEYSLAISYVSDVLFICSKP